MKQFYLPDWKIEEWNEPRNGETEKEHKIHRLELVADWFLSQVESEKNWAELGAMRHALNALRCDARKESDTAGAWAWLDAFVDTLAKRLEEIIVEEFGADVWDLVK